MRLTPRLIAGAFAWIVLGSPVHGQTEREVEDARLEFFETKIRPVLINNCYNCHSANTKALGGLRVDDRTGLLEGGNRGPAVIPGDPEKSLLIQAVRHTHVKLKMPPDGKLTEQEADHLAAWVEQGAAWPSVRVPASVGRYAEKYAKLRKEHWAWQPLRTPATPEVKDDAWPRDDIDRHVLATLEAAKLAPAGDADRLTLIRRVTFDLTGLPPTVDEIDNFLNDTSADALGRVVDRLLSSSAFGERWGRHWLDVARYAESTGSARNLPYPHAWRYRDYVIDSFNNDKPYDQFIREQIAGDLLPARTQEQRDTQLIATGFLALGVKDVNQRFKIRFLMDNIDEQIDTVTRAVLALTASCARCHDHKFDPIPTADYYALAGIFQSTDHCSGLRNKMGGGGLDYYDPNLLLVLGGSGDVDNDLEVADQIAVTRAAYESAREDLQMLAGTPAAQEVLADGQTRQTALRQRVNRLQQELFALTDPAVHSKVALGVRDAQKIGDTEMRIRGEAEKLRPLVPRGFLSLVEVPDAPKINPQQSGRLELAQWLSSPDNPLTSRVIVNRVWKHLFGQGIVATVDNFGTTGDAPSHPELLDHLASRFIRDGWSIKKLIRSIVLTRVYQLDSTPAAGQMDVDPANRLLGRHRPRRLDAEEIRDAMLAASGVLTRARPEASPAQALKVVELRNNGPEAKRFEELAASSTHRSVYLPLLRGLTPRALEVFDFAQQGMVTGNRDATTVAPQALYLLNDPFVIAQAQTLARRLLDRNELDDAGRIDLAYRWTLGRSASSKEMERAVRYLSESSGETGDAHTEVRVASFASFTQALFACAEFRYIR